MNDYDKKVQEAPYQPGYEDAVINPTPKQKDFKEINAYKLADEVIEHYNSEKQKGFNVNWMQEVANMIRKQANQIKELEIKYKQEFDYVEYLLKERKR